jgi:nucleoside 2-deoxyribosyltransferase
MTIYLAAPLFSAAERQFNKDFAAALKHTDGLEDVFIILPQVKADELKGEKDFIYKMYNYCLRAIDDSDLVLSILEGPDTDSGTCVEMGYAHARQKPIIGVRTDFRNSEDRGVNLMVSNVCHTFIWEPCAEIELLALKAGKIIRKFMQN